jgi:DNA replication initiation complex subunit (GINS family)
MITLEQIVSSNLQMLKEQEESLLKSLEFVRKARQLFKSKGSAKSGPKKARKTKAAAAKPRPAKAAGKKKTRNRKGGKHIDRIIEVLKAQKGPMPSADLISTLFKQQTADKDMKHFSTLIYPVLTKAYKAKTLALKSGKIHLN